MFGGTSSAAGMCRSRIIHDRINPGIADKIQILEDFLNILKATLAVIFIKWE